MVPDTKKVVVEALRLPKESRALLAEKLLESLDYDEDFEVSAEWRDEIRRRVKKIDEKKVDLVSASQVFKEISKKLK